MTSHNLNKPVYIMECGQVVKNLHCLLPDFPMVTVQHLLLVISQFHKLLLSY